MIEYRVLWMELIAGSLVPFSGKVFDNIDVAEAHARLRRREPNCRDVLIEARAKSEEPWPNPLDPADVWLSKVRGAKNAE